MLLEVIANKSVCLSLDLSIDLTDKKSACETYI